MVPLPRGGVASSSKPTAAVTQVVPRQQQQQLQRQHQHRRSSSPRLHRLQHPSPAMALVAPPASTPPRAGTSGGGSGGAGAVAGAGAGAGIGGGGGGTETQGSSPNGTTPTSTPPPPPAEALSPPPVAAEDVVVGGNAAGSEDWRRQMTTEAAEATAPPAKAAWASPPRNPDGSSGAWKPPPHQKSAGEVWEAIRAAARDAAAAEPALASFLHTTVLVHSSLAKSVAFLLANKLASRTLLGTQLASTIADAYASDPSMLDALVADLQAVADRDPACESYCQCLLYFKGFQALQCHRIAHHLWLRGRRPLALAVQSRVSEVLHVDIHPGARVGRAVMIDHATGVVVGETAVVGDGVSLLHHVTLGGSGTGRGARHPHIGDGALLGAGVCVLGPVTVGAGSKVGAGSVVVTDLPPHCVAVGVPARIVRTGLTADPAADMNAVDDFDWVI